MDEISRREFLKQSAATSAAAAFLPIAAREMQMNPLGLPIGSQTWPHRQRIKDGDFAGLCRDMAALGIGSIELCSPGYPEFTGLVDGKQTRKVIEDHGLTCPSAHVTMAELRNAKLSMERDEFVTREVRDQYSSLPDTAVIRDRQVDIEDDGEHPDGQPFAIARLRLPEMLARTINGY